MLQVAHLRQIRETQPFIVVIIAGILVFLADLKEVSNPAIRELTLTIFSLGKSVWFIRFVIRRIRLSTISDFYFHEFMAFLAFSIILFVLSFAIDFYCLYQIRSDAFHGLSPHPDLLNDFITFFYFSVTNFTTAGLGDIVPGTTSARLFIAAELIISFFFTIFIIANLAMLRESFEKKRKR